MRLCTMPLPRCDSRTILSCMADGTALWCIEFLAAQLAACSTPPHLPARLCSSEHAFAAGTPQHAWVEAELASVDRGKTPWVIVGMHRMP